MSHNVQPDGYCETCRTIPCHDRGRSTTRSGQLDRLELKLNRILRHLGIDPEKSE